MHIQFLSLKNVLDHFPPSRRHRLSALSPFIFIFVAGLVHMQVSIKTCRYMFFFAFFTVFKKRELRQTTFICIFSLSVYPSGVYQAKVSFRFVGAYREVAKTSFNCYKITVKVELGGTPMCSSCATIGWNAKGQDFPIARLHCTSQVVCSTAYCLRSYFSAL